MSKVSVLIPIYNVEKYLNQCLYSVVNQTLQDIEIICINDGSTDSSPAIINEYAAKDSRIKVIDKPNSGYGHSMNQGLKLAQGEYIGIVESDDFAELNMFETLYDKAKSVGADIVKSNYWSQVRNEAIFSEYLKQEPYGTIFSPRADDPKILCCFPNIWSGIYKREFLQTNNIYFNETPGASYQDVAFSFKALSCAEKVFLIREAFLHYRRDNPNASVKSKKKAFCIFDEFDEIKNFLSQHKEFNNPCAYAFSVMKYKEYESNFRRIDNVFRFEFFQRIIKEFKKDKAASYLNENYWQADKWHDLQILLSDNKRAFYNQYEKFQSYQMCVRDIFSTITSFDKVYVYGAGLVSAYVLSSLSQRKINVEGVVVSTTKNNPNNFMNIPVSALSETSINKENDLIIIAMKEENQYNLLYQLQESGYANVMVISRALYGFLNL